MVEILLTIPFVVGTMWLILNILCLPKMTASDESNITISVLVPMRNEEARVEKLIHMLEAVEYTHVEYLLYDDDSTDQTVEKTENLIRGNPNFKLLRGKSLPGEWQGKPHACQQLANEAQGELLLWIDADVTFAPQTLQALANQFDNKKVDALSGFPKFLNSSFLEALLTPLLHFFIHMHLPIKLANSQAMVAASAASGAFIAIRRSVYEAIGGHYAVKNKIVEDIALFREVKRAGYHAALYHIADEVSCTMYGNAKDTWYGFEKNCFKAFNESYLMAWGVISFYLLYYVLPLPLAIYAIFTGDPLLFLPLLCIMFQRLISDRVARQLNYTSLLMPLSAFIYCTLLIVTMWKKKQNIKTDWKGREV